MKDDQKGESMEEANLTSNSLELPALPNGKVIKFIPIALIFSLAVPVRGDL